MIDSNSNEAIRQAIENLNKQGITDRRASTVLGSAASTVPSKVSRGMKAADALKDPEIRKQLGLQNTTEPQKPVVSDKLKYELQISALEGLIEGLVSTFKKEAKKLERKQDDQTASPQNTNTWMKSIEERFNSVVETFKTWTPLFMNIDKNVSEVARKMGIDAKASDFKEGQKNSKEEASLFKGPDSERGLSVRDRLGGRWGDFKTNSMEFIRSIITNLITGAIKVIIGLGASALVAGTLVATLLPKEYTDLIKSALKGFWEGLKDVFPALQKLENIVGAVVSTMKTVKKAFDWVYEALTPFYGFVFRLGEAIGSVITLVESVVNKFSAKTPEQKRAEAYKNDQDQKFEAEYRRSNPAANPRSKTDQLKWNEKYYKALEEHGKRVDDDITKGKHLPTGTTSTNTSSSVATKNGLSISEPSTNTEFNYDAYASALGKRESNGKYDAINKFGYIGKYQFGAAALEDAGLIKKGASKIGNKALDNPSNWTIEGGKQAFLHSPQLQEETMKKFTNLNMKQLMKRGVISKDSTPSEIAASLAASHLVGVGGAKDLSRGITRQDGFGTSSSEYAKLGAKSQEQPSLQPSNNNTGNMVASATTSWREQERKDSAPVVIQTNAPSVAPTQQVRATQTSTSTTSIPSPVANRGSLDRELYYMTIPINSAS